MNNMQSHFNDLQFLRFPFLGARADGESFAYLLMTISKDKASIATSKWMVSHTLLNREEKIDLFIPSSFALEYDLRNHVPGFITSISQKEIEHEQLYEISFTNELPLPHSNHYSLAEFTDHLPSDISPLNMLLRLIKDSLLLKQGILVYLKHFSTYFSRIVNYSSENYSELNRLIFGDIINKIKKKEKIYEETYFSLKKQITTLQDISIFLNLDELRDLMESEINLDLFLVAFGEVTSREELLMFLDKPKLEVDYNRNNKYMTYLLAIKNLEKRLYSNYNQIVLIYVKSILDN